MFIVAFLSNGIYIGYGMEIDFVNSNSNSSIFLLFGILSLPFVVRFSSLSLLSSVLLLVSTITLKLRL